jgi:MFS family permease
MRLFYNPLEFFLVVLVVGAGLAGMTVLVNALVPDFVRRSRDNATQHTLRAFLIGVINLFFFGLITAVLLSRPAILKGIGIVCATILLTFLMLGAATIARAVGEKLRPNDASVTKQVLAGIVTVELSEMVPLVGWIVVPIVAASTGLGAVILSLFNWHAAPTQDPAV